LNRKGGFLTNTECRIWATRIKDGTDFTSGDSSPAQVYAIGRWK